MDFWRRLYGAHPAHLLVLAASFVLAVVALDALLVTRGWDRAGWLLGAAVVHDLLLLPAYVALDAGLVALWRRHPGRVAWLTFVRLPLVVSGALLLVFSPVILRLSTGYEGKTGRSMDGFLGDWLLVTAVLAAGSLLAYLARVAAVRRRSGRGPGSLT